MKSNEQKTVAARRRQKTKGKGNSDNRRSAKAEDDFE
jgi:hypothetical protein